MEGASRRSSGSFAAGDEGIAYGSTASLASMHYCLLYPVDLFLICFVLTRYSSGNVAAPGVESRPSEGPGEHDGNTEVTATDAATAVLPEPTPKSSKPPVYRRRWFFFTGLFSGAVGLALLFIVLWPVVKAIAQLVVNRSVLNVDQAIITNPQNGS